VRVGPTLNKLLAEYPENVRIVYKMHPLPMHSQAMLAAEAALAAHAQGRFDAMHQKLLENSRSLSRDKVLAIADELQLDVDRFTKDLDSHAHKAAIDAGIKEAMTLGATGTPASFINGRFLSGAQPYENFKRFVDRELTAE
jgi:predicted DsbA family dithiol-disulfide isomerase